jgi:hypothetical protein
LNAITRHENTTTRNAYGVVFRAFVMSWLIVSVGGPMSAQERSSSRTIEKGDQSNVEDTRQVLVRTDAEWTALWNQHAQGRAKPKVDFSKEMVVGLFMGSRPNAGFSTAVTLTTAANGALIVKYTETVPPRDAITASVLTFPFHLVAIPKSDVKDVKFEKAADSRK